MGSLDKIYSGVDKNSGAINSGVNTSANVIKLTPAAEQLHGEEKLVYGEAGNQHIANRSIMNESIAKLMV